MQGIERQPIEWALASARRKWFGVPPESDESIHSDLLGFPDRAVQTLQVFVD